MIITSSSSTTHDVASGRTTVTITIAYILGRGRVPEVLDSQWRTRVPVTHSGSFWSGDGSMHRGVRNRVLLRAEG